MQKDDVFKEELSKPSDFKFSSKVAKVFDDMVNRSVPFYEEMQRMISEIAADHVVEGTNVYDLGCSTGTSLIMMDQTIPAHIRFVGIDDSPEMLSKCDSKLRDSGFNRPYDLQVADLNMGVTIENASVVLLCLTLQFVRPIYREKLLKCIINGMAPGGILIIVEKILAEDSIFNRDFIKYYYDMKRRHHYSDMEISQKREALENVLIPYKLSENILMLKEAGFGHCEVFFKWYNFSGIIAKKENAMIAIGNFFFRYRNVLFIFLYLALFIPSPDLFSEEALGPTYYYWPIIIGLLVTVSGQAIRGATIGLAYIIRGEKDGQVYAEELVTQGIFNHCRNPLYLGNILMLLGVGILSNSLLYLLLLIPLFLLIYHAIVLAEENFLRKKFGASFDHYCKRVNRWIPRLKGLNKTFNSMEFRATRWILKEYNTQYVWLTGIVLILLLTYPQLTDYSADRRNMLLAILLPLLLAAYLIIRYLKKSGKVLE